MSVSIGCTVTSFRTLVAQQQLIIQMVTAAIPGANPSAQTFEVVLEGTDLNAVRVATVTAIRAASPPADDTAANALFAASFQAAMQSVLVSKGLISG